MNPDNLISITLTDRLAYTNCAIFVVPTESEGRVTKIVKVE